MFKIFFEDHYVCISSAFPERRDGFKGLLVRVSAVEVKQLDVIGLMEGVNGDIHLLTEDPPAVFDALFSSFEKVDAAGGLVTDGDDLLWIYRNNKWDLPKGKVEKGESMEEAALREVEEECGVTSLKLIKEIAETYHTYRMNEKWHLKRTKWFRMSGNHKEMGKPQNEEGISEIKWVPFTKSTELLKDTFASIRELLISHLPYIFS